MITIEQANALDGIAKALQDDICGLRDSLATLAMEDTRRRQRIEASDALLQGLEMLQSNLHVFKSVLKAKASQREIGDRAACKHCGTDIEWHGPPRRELLSQDSPLTMIRGGWMDRGSNRKCNDGKHVHAPYLPVND